jgi:hypothetical protein
LQDYSSNLKTKEIINKIKISKEHKIDLQKPRSYTFDTKNSNSNNIPIKINLGNLNFFGNNKMKNYINLLGNNDISTENRKNIFLNTNKLPKIINRLSLSNFHKNNNNNEIGDDNKKNKFSIFNKTSGTIGFKGITFNNGISAFRNTNYKINNINNLNTCKLINSHKEIFKYKISKEQIMNLNNTNNINKDFNNLNNLYFNSTNINSNKDKKKSYVNKNTFNTKAVIHNCNKCYNNSNINQVNNNIALFKNNKKEKDELKEKFKIKENEEKNNLCEENNDSFINEFNDLFSNVKSNNDSQPHFQENIVDENNKINESDDDDKEPDPRINFEQISRVNKSRPQTSYGGLNARRKNLQSAMQNVRNKKNRPTTSNIPE